jgi:hypothetical protein
MDKMGIGQNGKLTKEQLDKMSLRQVLALEHSFSTIGKIKNPLTKINCSLLLQGAYNINPIQRYGKLGYLSLTENLTLVLYY